MTEKNTGDRFTGPDGHRRFGPIHADDKRFGICPLCGSPFREGQFMRLLGKQPTDPEEARKAAAGRAYTTEAIPAHYNCWRSSDPTAPIGGPLQPEDEP